ncbi:MAG: phosphoribulokinase [Acidobacteriia bacterium]|nr:phosphoribulokinase [Terriglobia bacterium]
MTGRRPVLLGIMGDSAAGKTTLTQGLTNLLGAHRVTHMCTDDYHKYDRAQRAALNITALDPDCNYLDILELQLERLHYGQPILKPVYEHATGTLIRPEYIKPREFVIVEGLLGFHSGVMRQFYDVKVYLEPPEDLRRVWKIRRDTAKRGYTVDQVLAELEKREADSREFIRTQRERADIVVQFYPPYGVSAEGANGHLNVRLILRPTIPHPDMSYLSEKQSQDTGIRLLLGRDTGRPVDILEIDGSVTPEQAAYLEETIWRHLPGVDPIGADQFGVYQDRGVKRQSDPLALTQLLLTYHLLRECGENTQRLFAPPVAALSRVSKAGVPSASTVTGALAPAPETIGQLR